MLLCAASYGPHCMEDKLSIILQIRSMMASLMCECARILNEILFCERGFGVRVTFTSLDFE